MARLSISIWLAVLIAILIAGAGAQDSIPPVYLNEIRIYISSETYEALKASPLIREEFSAWRETTNHAEDAAVSYSGLYLYGMHTHFEILKAGYSELSHKVESPGRISMAMWVDHRTQLPILHDRLPAASLSTRRDAQNQPRYDYINEDLAKAEGVTSWVLGLYPDGLVRSEARYQPDRLLHDIVACTVTVRPLEREELVRNYRAYGYTIADESSRAVVAGPDFTLTALTERLEQPRTASIEMTLNREKSGEQNYRMDDAELQFAANRATLILRFPR